MNAVAFDPTTVLVKPYRHPITWTRNLVQKLAYAGLGAYIGMLIIVAVYYLLFETTGTMNTWWHHTVSNSDLRHTIRDVGEALLGGLLGKQLAFNFFKKRYQKKLDKRPNLLDRIEIALRIPNPKDGKPFSVFQMVVTPFLVLLYAAPGLLVGFEFVHWVRGMHLHATLPVSQNPTTTTLASKLEATWTADWPKKLVGYFAAFFFGIRPARGMFADVQLMFAERRVQSGAGTAWYFPAAVNARIKEVEANGVQTLHHQSRWLKRMVIYGSLVGFGLACFGWYVLAYIA